VGVDGWMEMDVVCLVWRWYGLIGDEWSSDFLLCLILCCVVWVWTAIAVPRIMGLLESCAGGSDLSGSRALYSDSILVRQYSSGALLVSAAWAGRRVQKRLCEQ
jgi:hypothetical protein